MLPPESEVRSLSTQTLPKNYQPGTMIPGLRHVIHTRVTGGWGVGGGHWQTSGPIIILLVSDSLGHLPPHPSQLSPANLL